MERVIARYPLATELNGFDYFGWQAQVVQAGATEIVFDTRGVADLRRFHSIIQPGPNLIGLPSSVGTDGEVMASSRFRYLAEFARGCTTFKRLRSLLPPASWTYTVTLREQTTKTPERNSNLQAWTTFAAEIGALLIRDFDRERISLYQRMSIYAGARMNFFVASGPNVLCALSEYPCVGFGWGWNWGNGFLEKAGIRYQDNMPWCDVARNQFTVWENDDLDVIREWFAQWRRTCGL